MRQKFPVWLILTIACILSLIIGGKIIYDESIHIKFSEETFQGNIKVMNGVELDLDYTDRNELWWNMKLSFDHGINAINKFTTSYYKNLEQNNNPLIYLRVGEFSFEKVFLNEMSEDSGKKTVKIADYYQYLPIDIQVSYGTMGTLIQGDNTIYKVKVPDTATATLEKGFNSRSISYEGIHYVSNRIPVVVIEDRMYFTITNLEMVSDYYSIADPIETEYFLQTGILSIPMQKETIESVTYDDIEVNFPMELKTGSDIAVLDLDALTDDNLLALTTLEQQSLYIYLYDIKKNQLINKRKVADIPDNLYVNNVEVNSQGDYLLAHYQYMKANGINEPYDSYLTAAVYEVTKDHEIQVILDNEYYSQLKDEYQFFWNMDNNRLLYKNEKLYLLTQTYATEEDRNTSLSMIALNNEDVLYYGVIRNSMMEDYTIASPYRDNEMLLSGNSTRMRYKEEFID